MSRLLRPVARLLALVLLLFGLGGCSLVEDDAMTITVELADSSGLFVGNDVGILGVKAGEVTEIDPQGDHVEVTLEVDAGTKIPADAGAVVVSRSLATDRYVELTPVYQDGPTMESGDVIEISRTRTPVEWDELLGAVNTLTEGLNGNGKPLEQFLNRTADSFQGNGRTVRRAIKNLVAGTGAFSSHSDEFANALTNLDELTRGIAKNEKVARRFIRTISTVTELFKDERHNLESATDSISRTLGLLAIFVRHHKDDLSGLATDIEDISKRILKHKKSLSETLRVTPVAMENLGRAINDRGRLDIKLPTMMLLPGSEIWKSLCDLLPKGVCDLVGPDVDLLELIKALLGRGGQG